ncbi:Protein ANTAGONIST OF LIKE HETEROCHROMATIN PROTEIN 1 [Frankliniella fusca]|uniref:Protein ANTAGONIST OF LIKE HETEROCHROMATIN PROTEIN 1 n=1 Tax=Frankliniella fusca TaxID=407009 RepID=A0AAE1HGF4_9NEOP|nr:Protein ANTAGONIST OF LIKE HETEROCHROMATIN PROTEIN 1 [Frankliniella fusca]
MDSELMWDDEVELMMIMAAMEEDMGDDSDGGGKDELVQVDVEGYRMMSNASFKAHFRMDRIVFEKLVVVVGLHMRRTNRLKKLYTGVDKIVMMGLWPLFNQDTFRSTGLHFQKMRGGIHEHYRCLIEVLSELSEKYVKWPDELERQTIQEEFAMKYGYIGAVGCIDGIHIEITAPLENPNDYINRHHTYSLLVQAVCDQNLLYRDVYIGNPGAIGDVRNFDNSPLSRNLLTNPDMLSEGEHILGDGAYTLTDKLIIPYGDDGHIPDWMRTHNSLLSACRVKIENSFALLRGKHRRLKKLPMRNPYLTRYHIAACFVLSNFITLKGDECRGLPPAQPPPIPQDEYNRLLAESRQRGAIKREFIANVLHPHR